MYRTELRDGVIAIRFDGTETLLYVAKQVSLSEEEIDVLISVLSKAKERRAEFKERRLPD
ncbi:MAG: hypothetical protein UY48_C0006G0053 [Candidatus Gottesmanbacteria bacterium GW2011_GWB1_49_7]|uniref:Uncharacterized protein n=1 Tax=Candidatus Gottesmanbacteria bacterium GW2011_GWB1_49_7 TaxID=1618448 RepID=A0A0G1W329_9BACT|nr:MAG: hypothetical protein UY48_C0006G0053 [Candidatus Gottesmanbacteria bacterium GW2011_GWB1_49_7]